jgi:peptide deformylase
MVYTIVIVPDPVLKAKASPVAAVDDALRRQMDDMIATMYDAAGIGLAANQVGLLNRVIVMDVAQREGETQRRPVFMVNPQIVAASEEQSIYEEGCLSIPGQYAEVERPITVRVKYLDYDGKPKEVLAERMLARCVQHEIDHLNGTLFIDYLSTLKRNMILRKLEKSRKLDGDIIE